MPPLPLALDCTLLDHFAAQAMIGLLAAEMPEWNYSIGKDGSERSDEERNKVIAKGSYDLAVAMMQERERRKAQATVSMGDFYGQ